VYVQITSAASFASLASSSLASFSSSSSHARTADVAGRPPGLGLAIGANSSLFPRGRATCEIESVCMQMIIRLGTHYQHHH
jgi:hypothetical protein